MRTYGENSEWIQLTELTTAIVKEGRARGETIWRSTAFQEACEQRPDLARVAISPGGEPIAERPEIAQILKEHPEPEKPAPKTAEEALFDPADAAELRHRWKASQQATQV